MKSTILFTLLLVAFSSCEKVIGTGPVVTETRDLSNFTGVSSSFDGKVDIQIGTGFSVELVAQQNILDILRTEVNNGVLSIFYKNNVNVRSRDDVRVRITMPLVDYLKISGSGNMDLVGNQSSNTLDLQISGSGNISLQQANVNSSLDAWISGSGNINIYGGQAAHTELHISGSGDMDLLGLTTQTADTRISGSGSMRVKVVQNLKAQISGSGSVRYSGSPLISTQISGSGKVQPI